MNRGVKAVAAVGIAAGVMAAFVLGVRAGRPSIPALTRTEEQTIEGAYAAPTPPPDNAAPVYYRVFARMRLDGYLEQDVRKPLEQVLDGTISAEASGLPRPFPPAGERAYVWDDWCEYEEIERAQGMDCDFNLDYSMGPMLPLPHLSGMRGLARVLALQARFDYEDSSIDLALKRIGYIFTMARHMSQEPLAISQNVASVIETIAIDTLVDMAFRLRDDAAFLSKAAGLLKGTPARLTEPGVIIRQDIQVTASYFLRRAGDPDVKSSEIIDELAICTGNSVSSISEDRFLWIDLAALRQRRALEQQLSLPGGWLSEKNLRPLMVKAAAVCLEEAEQYASAADAGPGAAAQWLKEFEEARTNLADKPEMFLAAMVVSGLADVPRNAALRDTRREAAIAVVEAPSNGSRRIAPLLDLFGSPYQVTWFEDAVYFESPSQWSEPHDLDFALPHGMSYEVFQLRLEAAKSGGQRPPAAE